MKITDLKCVVIPDKYSSFGGYPTIRIETDEGITGVSQIEDFKCMYIVPHVLMYKGPILQTDPTDVERVMLRIRHLGGIKPWGSSVSAIEMALWDIAGRALGAPEYKLLGGKVRDKVRAYCGGGRLFGDPVGESARSGNSPEDFAGEMKLKKSLPEGYSIIKTGINMQQMIDAGLAYGETDKTGLPYPRGKNRGMKEWKGSLETAPRFENQQITEKGLKYFVSCVKAMKDVLGDEIGLGLHATYGNTPQGLLQIARALEPFNMMWLEDFLSGDYYPYTTVQAYREVSENTTTPISTGEQLYLRQHCKDLIETHAIDAIEPDVADVGGIAEMKWICELADLHGVTFYPHGVGNGPFGLAHMTHMAAVFPKNYIGFETPRISSEWWDMTTGFPKAVVRNSYVDVSDRPGCGIELVESEVRKRLPEKEAEYFFGSKK